MMKKITLLILTFVMSFTFIYAQQRAIVKPNPQKIVNNAKPAAGSVDFEDITDFALTFDPWTVNDVDGSTTYGITDVTFPNSGTAMAFLCFNPTQTTPAIADWDAHSGDKYAACFASTTPDNNDWFISPKVALPATDAQFAFWAKSITDTYGLERFNVAVSTTDNDPASFTVISGASYIEAPIAWTEYTYDLAAYAGQNVYVAIQCVSSDAFCFQIDDITLTAGENALFSDDFESYTAGEYLALNSDVWTTWSNDPGSAEDALVLEEQSHSATKAPKVDGSTDLILPLGNKTSGKYHVSFQMYIPADKAGYYNFQKFEAPGNEWAFELYFGNNNHASLKADSDTSNVGFSYNHDEWFEMNQVIDLDKDSAWIYYNGTLIHKWQYSVDCSTFEPGTLQLGSIDFFAGGTDPEYYFDDLSYVEDIPPSTIPIINVSTDPISSNVDSGSTTTETLNIANDGGGDLDYNIVVCYPAATKRQSIPEPILNNTFNKNSVELSLDPNASPAANNPAAKDEVLHYDGDNASAIGLNSPGEYKVAAMFPASMVAPYVGMEINAVDVFINDAPNSAKILIYDMGSSNVPGPGNLIYEQEFTAAPTEWNHVVLTTPLKITGADVWVGYIHDQPADVHCAGTDAGPHNENGDWISTGPGWSHLSDSPTLDYNWNIRANLSGTPSVNWLSTTPDLGTIAAGENLDITLNIDGTLLTEPEYHANLIVRSNDLANEYVEIPVNLTVTIAENVLFSDDFESYTAGEYLALNSEDWTTWSNNPGSAEDALVLEEQSHSVTKAPKVDGSTDLILPLGNKTSGKYHVSWYMYIPVDKAGYYNFQKFEAPGNEWAFELYFGNNNHASLKADSDTSNVGFSYNHDEWFEMNQVIDLDKDSAWIYYNGTLIHKWQYSVDCSTFEPGTLQLGSIDFFAGGTDPEYYFDDIVYVEDIPPSTIPIINLSTDPISSIVAPGNTTTETLNIANDGGGDLDYNIAVTYPGAKKISYIPEQILNNTFNKNSVELSLDPNASPAANNPATKDEVLHYDGDNASAIGLNSPGEYKVAAMFPASMIAPYVGMEISFVDVYINDAPNSAKILIYDMGSSNVPGPGNLIYEQEFTAAPTEWNHVVLTTPLKLTGADVWVGYIHDQPADVHCAGTDAGPHNENGDWISTGPGWSHLSDSPDLDYNWNIRANLTGTPSVNWLSTTPDAGTIAAGENLDITLNIDGTLLTEPEYHANLIVRSNDLDNERLEVAVDLTVTVGINETTFNTLIYPNPANNYVIIKSERNINRINIFNYVGQMVSENIVNNNTFRINTEAYKTGIYLIQIETTEGLITKKLYIK